MAKRERIEEKARTESKKTLSPLSLWHKRNHKNGPITNSHRLIRVIRLVAHIKSDPVNGTEG